MRWPACSCSPWDWRSGAGSGPGRCRRSPSSIWGCGSISCSRPRARAGASGPAEGGNRLWIRRFDQLDATPLAGPEGAGTPFFAPDGQRVGFVKAGTAIRVASLAGAPTVTLTEKANTTGADWGDDGYLYFEVDSGIGRLRATGGDIEQV